MYKTKNNKTKLKVGSIITCSYAILKKHVINTKYQSSNFSKKKYYWTVLHFTGLCLKFVKATNTLVLKNYCGLFGFFFKISLNSPNILYLFTWKSNINNNYNIHVTKKSLYFLIKKQEKNLKKFKLC